MSPHPEPAGALDERTAVRRVSAPCLVCALLVISSISIFSGDAVSDPVVTDYPDDTRSVLWDFDDVEDYSMAGTSLVGGDAVLEYLNLTDGDHLQEEFEEGTLTNIDADTVPGSVIIGVGGPVQTFVSELGPNVTDAYIVENWPDDNYGGTYSLYLDSELDKISRILLQFDVSAIPGIAHIVDATLWLHEQQGSRGENLECNIHALAVPFEEDEVTWARNETASTWVSPGGDYGNHSYGTYTITSQTDWVGFDLSELVEGWTDGTLANYGVIIVPESTVDDRQKVFQSSDDNEPVEHGPYLIVNYSMPLDAGEFQSRLLGPGTNSTFTLASYSTSAFSHLDDDFDGGEPSPDWQWTNDPVDYDIGVTREGWLHVEGSPETEIRDSTVTCNYIHQTASGNFSASTHIEDSFADNGMGAGLLLFQNTSEWMYVAKVRHISTDRIQVVVCSGGSSGLLSDIVWAWGSSAHIRLERDSGAVRFYSSSDGVTWQQVYNRVLGTPLEDEISVGLFVYSNGPTNPVAEFDHFTAYLMDEPTVLVKVRVGDSASTDDGSWEDWADVPVMDSPAVLREEGRYAQYMVYLSSPEAWYTPAFSGFDCSYELYSQSGTIETEEFVPEDFSMWLGMSTDETDYFGRVEYRYSTDGGDTWTYAGMGGSYAFTSAEPSLKVRATLTTYDTLRSPMVHSVSAIHVTALTHLDVEAPSEVVAGEPFSVTVTAKDSTNYTMEHWLGGITLQAMELDGVTPKDTELEVTSAWISTPGVGYVTILNEVFTEAGDMLIKASSGDAYGLSGPVTVLPATISSIHITPTVSVLLEGAQQVFTGIAQDIYGNILPGTEYSWLVDGDIGTLDRYNGSTVIFTAGEAGSSGYIRVSAGGLMASLDITITYTDNEPEFESEVPDQTKYEDFGSWTVDLGPYVQDAVHHDSELRWFATGEDVVDVSGENRTGNLVMTISTRLDRSGTDLLTIVVVDPDGLSASTTMSVKIAPVNDWPSISIIDPLVVHYDILYIYNLKYYIQDVDDIEDNLTMRVDDASTPYVTVHDLALHITYPVEFTGTTQTVIVTVSDGDADASTVIRVTVSDNNVPFLADSLPGVDMNQGETLLDVFDLDEYFADHDGDPLSFTYWYSHVLVNISEGNIVNLFAPTDWYGSEYIIFSATDPWGARVESAATILVHRVNQPPEIEGVPDLTVKYDLEYRFDLTWYVSDPDDDIDDLHVTTDDTHAVPEGMTLVLEYPEAMKGALIYVTITVSDGEFSDSCLIKVTVGDNAPPVAGTLPMHTFQEDLPQAYPSSGGLGPYFTDDEGGPLTFETFSMTDGVTATALEDDLGEWTVDFSTSANWNGYAWFVVRCTDPGGALVETVAELTVIPVPDAPVLEFNETVQAQTGVQRAVDLFEWASDPDTQRQELDFTVSSTYASYVTIWEGVLVLEFPDEFLDNGEEQRQIEISVSVSDPDGLHDTDLLSVIVVGGADEGSDQWLIAGMAAMAVLASGSFLVAMRLRKRPFVIKDMMVIHNDGFLIGRAAAKSEGEIDEDVLSGMLTAVLNFVEDSMAKTEDGLRSFGFKHYKVLVRRGRMTYMAVVYEGDAPEATEDRLGELLAKVEKIYRKRIENWTGDMDTDFAGIEVLLQAFVKENSRRGGQLNGGLSVKDEGEEKE